jgi:alpha-L-rhamnosidase
VVEIPRGTFRSGSIFLKNGVDLYLDEGAVLLGSNKIEDYPKRMTRIEGHFEPWRMALVNAQHMDRVRIGGQGKLDGNGILFWAAFWQRRKENPQCTNLEVERPRLVFIDRSHDVRISGLALQDSGFWNLHLYRCHDVVAEGLTITAPTKGHILGPSTDGMDIDSCQDVTIRGCRIEVNDDNIALKGSKGPLADHDVDSPPDENILIEDCSFGDGNGMLTCGSEATLIRHVTVRNCRITGRTNLVCLKLRPDTPQDYEDITIDGVQLSGGAGRILQVAPWRQFFDLQGHAPPTQRISGLTIRNVTGSFHSFGGIRGNPGDTIRNITLENFDVKLAEPRLDLGPTEHVVFTNVKVNGMACAVPAATP